MTFLLLNLLYLYRDLPLLAVDSVYRFIGFWRSMYQMLCTPRSDLVSSLLQAVFLKKQHFSFPSVFLSFVLGLFILFMSIGCEPSPPALSVSLVDSQLKRDQNVSLVSSQDMSTSIGGSNQMMNGVNEGGSEGGLMNNEQVEGGSRMDSGFGGEINGGISGGIDGGENQGGSFMVSDLDFGVLSDQGMNSNDALDVGMNDINEINDMSTVNRPDAQSQEEWQPDLTDYCEEVRGFGPVFSNRVQRWLDQDQNPPFNPYKVMMVGSSSVRRWEAFTRLFDEYHPVQRGFGGAQLGEVAYFIPQILEPHPDLEALLVFAGTNDLGLGIPVDVVMERMRCLRQRVAESHGWTFPILWIGVTPTPARWNQQSNVQSFNDAVERYAEDDPYFYYIDTPSLFLDARSEQAQRQNQPPPLSLYDADQLHLSAAGYALWEPAIRAVLSSIVNLPFSFAPPPPLSSGTTLRIDFGSQDQLHGEATPSPDYLGFSWNNWPALNGRDTLLTGEHLENLVTTSGQRTSVGITATAGCRMVGWQDGGQRWPMESEYDQLAVGSATGDLCAVEGTDLTGGFRISGLPSQSRIRLRWVSGVPMGLNQSLRLEVYGGSANQVIGQNQFNSSAAPVQTLDNLQPTPHGELYIDLIQQGGQVMGLSLLEISIE